MKVLKILGLIAITVLALILITPIFLADTVTITHTETIQTKAAVVFRQVNVLENWAHWSPFSKADPNMWIEFSDNAKGEGAHQVWKSDKIGNGSLTIATSIPYSYIENHIDFDGRGTAIGKWKFEEEKGNTEVSWSTTLPELGYPFGRFMGLLMQYSMKTMLADGLADLKTYCETQPDIPEITTISIQTQPTISILDSCTIDGIGELLGNNYQSLAEYADKRNIALSGAPFAIYHNWDPEGIIKIQAGFPVIDQLNNYGKIVFSELPGGKAVFAKHFGSYDSSPTHEAIEEYIRDLGLAPQSYIWEVYIKDHSNEADTAKWETHIYYPLK